MLVEVRKVELQDGEELMGFANKVMAAITQHRGKIGKSLSMLGIFKDHVVVRDMESGKTYRMELKRDDQGNVLLDGLDEVRQVFVPVKQKAQKSDGGLAVVTLHDFAVVTDDGELSDDMVTMIREAVSELAKAEAPDEPVYVEIREEPMWRGVLR